MKISAWDSLPRLTPAERLVFVLHDLFDMPFDEISPIVGRSPAAAKPNRSLSQLCWFMLRSRPLLRHTPDE